MPQPSCTDRDLTYQAPIWLPGGHIQTIWPRFLRTPASTLTRTRLEFADGDFIDIDTGQNFPNQPLIIMFHGLEGSSHSHYAQAMFRAAHANKINCALAHFRGCSGEPNRLLRAYHSGDSDEIGQILNYFRERYPNVKRYAYGVSLGGNALLKWLGEIGSQANYFIEAAVAVSAPLDLTVAGHHLARGFNRIYTEYFLRTMRQRAAYKATLFPKQFDGIRAQTAQTLYAFDDAYTAPIHGFANADDYWQRASSKPHLRAIAIPCLVLNARNDPFLPAHALPRKEEVSSQVSLYFPEQGGHVGFVQGPFPGNVDWLPRHVLQFLHLS